jgi:hypothetical protein
MKSSSSAKRTISSNRFEISFLDDPVGPPGGDVERHVAERLERLVGLEVGDEAPREDRALERRELPAVAVAAVDLADVADLDRVRHQTSSANESRRRSKRK